MRLMIPYPGFDKIAFEIGPIGNFGPLKVHWYGIMYLVAFAAAWCLGRLRASRPGSTWKPVDIDDFMFFGMLGTILGGRLGYVLFYGLSFWAKDPWYPFKVWDGGMSFHGGLLGVMIAFAIFAVRRRRRIADVFDFAAALPGIGICAVRIGNFINGELWGKPTDVSWAFVVDGVPRHATQLYEAALEGVLIFIISGGIRRSHGHAWRRPDCSSRCMRWRGSPWSSGGCPTSTSTTSPADG
jgi:phosphatidylglycerol:prolipoprotein diacylglycerol transferase